LSREYSDGERLDVPSFPTRRSSDLYLFGAIAAQGIAIMIEKKVDMFSSKNIAVIASIMIIGIGGNYAFGGNIPFFGLQVPCIARSEEHTSELQSRFDLVFRLLLEKK